MSKTSSTPGLWLKIRPQEAILIVITMIWGGTFLAIHHAMTVSGPFFLSGCASAPPRWR
ncbi:hypothetical protein GGER_20450 [Serratia rubidaea]